MFEVSDEEVPDECSPLPAEHGDYGEWRIELAKYRTSFARFPRGIGNRLLRRSWRLADASLTACHGAVLPESLRNGRPLR